MSNQAIYLEFKNMNLSIQKQNTNSQKGSKITDSEESVNSLQTDTFNRDIILDNINGFALPSQLTAVIGPSGCGKTSLLNLVADRLLINDKQVSFERTVLIYLIRLKETM